jgi:hypothetical protein
MAAHSVSSISSIISGSNGVLPSDAPGASIEETAAEMDDLAEIQGNPTHTRLNEEASQPPVDCEDATRRQMPWWKKPAPWWYAQSAEYFPHSLVHFMKAVNIGTTWQPCTGRDRCPTT